MLVYDQHLYKSSAIEVYGHYRLLLPCLMVPCWFFGIRGWKLLVWLGIEPKIRILIWTPSTPSSRLLPTMVKCCLLVSTLTMTLKRQPKSAKSCIYMNHYHPDSGSLADFCAIRAWKFADMARNQNRNLWSKFSIKCLGPLGYFNPFGWDLS